MFRSRLPYCMDMSDFPLISGLILLGLLASIGLLVLILVRFPRGGKIETFREELRLGREEAGRAARDSREEISS